MCGATNCRRRAGGGWRGGPLGLAALAVGAYLFVVGDRGQNRGWKNWPSMSAVLLWLQAMNEAVNAEMQRTPERYEELYTLAYGPDGTLTAMQADAAR